MVHPSLNRRAESGAYTGFRHQLDVLYETAKVIHSADTSPDVLHHICSMARKATGAKATSVRLVSSMGDKLLSRAAVGLSQEYLAKGPVEIDRSPMDREALSGHPVVITDLSQDTGFQYPDEARKEGIASVLSVPLRAADGTYVGVLRVYFGDLREFCEEEIDFVCALATLGAIAIQNANRFEHLTTRYEALVNYIHLP